MKKPNDSSENTTSPETLKPSPKEKPDTSSLSRPLTPSELDALKKDLQEVYRKYKGRFKHLA